MIEIRRVAIEQRTVYIDTDSWYPTLKVLGSFSKATLTMPHCFQDDRELSKFSFMIPWYLLLQCETLDKSSHSKKKNVAYVSIA